MAESLAEKYEDVVKEVNDIMGGKVLDYEAKRIKNEGREEGKKEGCFETLVSLVKENLLTIDVAAKKIGMTVQEPQLKSLRRF